MKNKQTSKQTNERTKQNKTYIKNVDYPLCPCHKIYIEKAVGQNISNLLSKIHDLCERVKSEAISLKFSFRQ